MSRRRLVTKLTSLSRLTEGGFAWIGGGGALSKKATAGGGGSSADEWECAAEVGESLGEVAGAQSSSSLTPRCPTGR